MTLPLKWSMQYYKQLLQRSMRESYLDFSKQRYNIRTEKMHFEEEGV